MLPLDAPHAACAEHLDLVDAAYADPIGPAAQTLKRTLCRHCPLSKACLIEAMIHQEDGTWGGTTRNWRTRHGAPSTHRRRKVA